MRWWCIHPGPAGIAHGCGATTGDGTSPPLLFASSPPLLSLLPFLLTP